MNDRPPRSTKVADDMLEWVLHFEDSKEVPQFTIDLGADSLEVACWWRHFCVEIGILSVNNQVFRDLVCSAPAGMKEAEEDRMQYAVRNRREPSTMMLVENRKRRRKLNTIMLVKNRKR